MKLPGFLSLLLLTASINPPHAGDLARVGEPAPPLAGPSLTGTSPDLDRLHGKVVLLILFSLQSEPSLREFSFVEREICQPGLPDGLVLIAVGRDQEEARLGSLAHDHPRFQIVADPKRQIFNRYAADAVPRTYVIGRDGRIQYAGIGFDEWEIDRIKGALLAALK